MYTRRLYIKMVLLTLVLLTILGCASSVMMKTPLMETPKNNFAQVTFLRPTYFGGAIQFSIWDSEDFIGVLSAGTYVQYLAKPGKHLFLARGENWSYVKATLAEGKKYYIIGRVFPGVWKARVALDPVKKGDEITQDQIDKWLKELTPMTVNPEKFTDYVTPRRSQVREAVRDSESGNVRFHVLEIGDHK